MNEKRRIFLNVLMSFGQVIVSGIAFLFLYRYLLDSIGTELAGVWALLLAWTTSLSVSDFGMSGGALKFVSRYRAHADESSVIQVVETSILSCGIILVIVLPATYPVFTKLAYLIIEPAEHIDDALTVLPHAIVAFGLTSLSSIIKSCIDGTQRVYLRNILVMGSALLYLVLTILLVPRAGFVGLAQAQVLQAGITLVTAWIMLRSVIPGLPLFPFRWSKRIFKEIFAYSFNFQLISITQLLFQPVTKSLLSIFGGVGQVFYFEMAHKLTMQLRGMIVIAHQSIVPAIAHWHEKNRAYVQIVYRNSFHILLVLVVAALPLLIGLAPVISRLWIGHYEHVFVLCLLFLTTGWFLNILSNPAYFGYLGIGRLRWNIVGHLVIGILSLVSGILLGRNFGGLGVVFAYAAAIPIGSSITLWAYHREYGIRWIELAGRHTGPLLLAGIGGELVIFFLHERLSDLLHPWLLVFLLLITYGLVVAVPLWRHPVRKMLQGWAAELATTTSQP